ncbi:MAG TPA: hypothetical protein VMW88_03005 [Thermoplasmata archaeon]|nr:hypothetical protein [Thermoplasmata archaeon]
MGVEMHYAKKQPTVAIEYPKVWFGLGAVVCTAGIVSSAYLAYESPEEFTRTFWMIAGSALAIFLVVFIIPSLITTHVAGEKGLHLRMGVLINATVPYAAIREIAPDTVKRGALTVGIGVRHKEKQRTMFVVSSFKNLVIIRLNIDLKLGGLLGPTVAQIVLSVKDIDSFLSTVACMSGAEEG